MALGPGWRLETGIKIALEELQNQTKPLFSRDSSHVGRFSQCAMCYVLQPIECLM